MKILIRGDVYNICNRIKNFDASYRVVYDTGLNKYKIYSIKLSGVSEIIGGVELSYVCTIPYEELDERTIKYLYNTSIENIDSFIKSLDDENNKLERQNELKLKQQSMQIAETKLRQLTK